jgi:hypothetical protein
LVHSGPALLEDDIRLAFQPPFSRLPDAPAVFNILHKIFVPDGDALCPSAVPFLSQFLKGFINPYLKVWPGFDD